MVVFWFWYACVRGLWDMCVVVLWRTVMVESNNSAHVPAPRRREAQPAGKYVLEFIEQIWQYVCSMVCPWSRSDQDGPFKAHTPSTAALGSISARTGL